MTIGGDDIWHETAGGRAWTMTGGGWAPGYRAFLVRVHVVELGPLTVSVPADQLGPGVDDLIDAAVDRVRPPPPRTAV